MADKLDKKDLDFLVKVMEKRIEPQSETPVNAGGTIGGEMSIPEPMRVNSLGDMDRAVYKKCSTIMAVCVNMVQKMLTDAANEAGIKPSDALKNIDAWVASFVDFPLPIFTFSETQTQNYKKDDSLSPPPLKW